MKLNRFACCACVNTISFFRSLASTSSNLGRLPTSPRGFPPLWNFGRTDLFEGELPTVPPEWKYFNGLRSPSHSKEIRFTAVLVSLPSNVSCFESALDVSASTGFVAFFSACWSSTLMTPSASFPSPRIFLTFSASALRSVSAISLSACDLSALTFFVFSAVACLSRRSITSFAAVVLPKIFLIFSATAFLSSSATPSRLPSYQRPFSYPFYSRYLSRFS